MISGDDGNTKFALFQGEPQGSRESAGFALIAFRVDGADFMEFLSGLSDVSLVNRRGKRVTRQAVVDHDLAYSIYFCDPYGHPLEVTTYDYDSVSPRLAHAQSSDNPSS